MRLRQKAKHYVNRARRFNVSVIFRCLHSNHLMAWASHSLFYTFEISGGKEGLDLQLDSVKAERP
jgi:hypothetical protein